MHRGGRRTHVPGALATVKKIEKFTRRAILAYVAERMRPAKLDYFGRLSGFNWGYRRLFSYACLFALLWV